MNQRDADPTALVGEAGHSRALAGGVVEPTTRRTEEEEQEREDAVDVDYVPVPPRNSQTVLVRFRRGTRLQPLPYSLDNEDT
jgi:hypothetical protein